MHLLGVCVGMSLGFFVSGLLGLELVGHLSGTPVGDSVMGLSVEDWIYAESGTLEGGFAG